MAGFHHNNKRIAAVLMALTLAACASNGGQKSARKSYPTPNPHAKVGSPYKVGGRTYVPRVDPTYDEIGIASWYGPNFHGKLTANGELFDENRLTAAHKTLPLPSLVRVTNLENGRTTIVRVNDRGPFSGDRIIDLSKRAAEVLGTRQQGLGRVRVEYLGAARMSDAIVSIGAPEDYAALHLPSEDKVIVAEAAIIPTPPSVRPQLAPTMTQADRVVRVAEPTLAASEPTPDGYYVRIGSFTNVANIRAIRAQLPPEMPMHVSSDEDGYNVIHHVKLGPYTHEFAAIEAQRYAKATGFSDASIVRETRAQ